MQCGGLVSQIFRSPLTRHLGLRQWHCGMAEFFLQRSQIALVQGMDAFAVHPVHSDLHREALAKPLWARLFGAMAIFWI